MAARPNDIVVRMRQIISSSGGGISGKYAGCLTLIAILSTIWVAVKIIKDLI